MDWIRCLDLPNGDWPYLLIGLCGTILGFLALWFVANVIRSALQGPLSRGSAKTLSRSSGNWKASATRVM
jgi:hypothetical protein